jgi:hypothetical protein
METAIAPRFLTTSECDYEGGKAAMGGAPGPSARTPSSRYRPPVAPRSGSNVPRPAENTAKAVEEHGRSIRTETRRAQSVNIASTTETGR